MLDKLVKALGAIDADTTALLTRFLIRASKSGNANNYIKERLKRIFEADDAPAPAASSIRR